MVSNENQIPLNIGQIVGTSKHYVMFESVSSSKPKTDFITTEDEASTQYPSDFIILEEDSFSFLGVNFGETAFGQFFFV